MAETALAQRVQAMRRFNRFYTRRIGVLHEKLLRSPFSLAEARVIYELAHHDSATATEIGSELDLDAGHLSRILRDLKKQSLIDKQPSPSDGRQSILSLTDKGQRAFATLNSRSQVEMEAVLKSLAARDQERLTRAMSTIETILGAQPENRVAYILRPLQPGDLGWVVQRHGLLYAREFGWDEQFEALVAEIVAKFIQNYKPKQERCWLVEREGENVGSVFLVRHSQTVAKLRLLLVEPGARGLGIGSRLVDECIRFARPAGYRKITLWTNSVLLAARRIYVRAGFKLVKAEPHHSFGHDLVGETWELGLG